MKLKVDVMEVQNTKWRRERIRQLIGVNTVNSSVVCKLFPLCLLAAILIFRVIIKHCLCEANKAGFECKLSHF